MEMVLALALGMLLLLALYMALNTHIFYVQVGRDTVAEATLARSVMARVTNDISGQIGPLDPRGLPDYNATKPADPENPDAAKNQPAGAQDMVVFNNGVRGEASFLILSGSRAQKVAAALPGETIDPAQITGDLRRIVYWIVSSGDKTLGLARAEIKQATSKDIDLDPMSLPEPEKYIIAPEVKKIEFEYFNGSGWQASWSGGDALDSSNPPTGPPGAIRITITLRQSKKGTAAGEAGNDDGPRFQQVVALPTSNSFQQRTPASTP